MRLLSWFLIIVGVSTLILTAYDHHRGTASVPGVEISMQIVEKADPIGFRNAVVTGYCFGLITLGIGLRAAWSARR